VEQRSLGLFQVLTEREETASVAIASNESFGWGDFGHVKTFGGQVPVTVKSFGFGALPVLISCGASPDRDLRVHLKPDPQVPVLVDLRAECEDTINDEYRIGWCLRAGYSSASQPFKTTPHSPTISSTHQCSKILKR
jgi:hypothetical protein